MYTASMSGSLASSSTDVYVLAPAISGWRSMNALAASSVLEHIAVTLMRESSDAPLNTQSRIRPLPMNPNLIIAIVFCQCKNEKSLGKIQGFLVGAEGVEPPTLCL